MQWLIDIIAERISEHIGFFHRSVTGNPDWNMFQLATTKSWQTWDCSAMVPLGTKAILIRVSTMTSEHPREIRIAPYDLHPWEQVARSSPPKLNTSFSEDKIIPLDDNRKFDTKVTHTYDYWDGVNITICGYWKR